MLGPQSTNARALLLSRRMATDDAARRQEVDGGRLVHSSRWSFVKRCLKTAELFGDSPASVPATCETLQVASRALGPVFALVKVQRLHPDGRWLDVDITDSDWPGQFLRLRSTSSHGAFSINYASGERSELWPLPEGVGIRQAYLVWSEPLRSAVFASLRRRGNVFRTNHKSELPKLHSEWLAPRSAMRDFVPLQGGSSLGWWWRLPDARSACRLEKARIGEWGEEYSFRRSLHKASHNRRRLERIEEPHLRVCYLCKRNLPETMAHLITQCQHDAMLKRRKHARTALCKIAKEASRIASCPPAPNFDDEQALYTILMGSTNVGRLDLACGAKASRMTTRATLRLQTTYPLEATRMRPACVWLSHLISAWISSMSCRPQSDDEKNLARLGLRIGQLIAWHSLLLHTDRRKALIGDAAFCSRTLDPKPTQIPRSKC